MWRYDHTFLRTVRKAQRLTQRQAARRAGFNLTMLSRYENGRIVPTGKTLAALANVYRVHPGSFFAAVELHDLSPQRTDENV